MALLPQWLLLGELLRNGSHFATAMKGMPDMKTITFAELCGTKVGRFNRVGPGSVQYLDYIVAGVVVKQKSQWSSHFSAEERENDEFAKYCDHTTFKQELKKRHHFLTKGTKWNRDFEAALAAGADKYLPDDYESEVGEADEGQRSSAASSPVHKEAVKSGEAPIQVDALAKTANADASPVPGPAPKKATVVGATTSIVKPRVVVSKIAVQSRAGKVQKKKTKK